MRSVLQRLRRPSAFLPGPPVISKHLVIMLAPSFIVQLHVVGRCVLWVVQHLQHRSIDYLKAAHPSSARKLSVENFKNSYAFFETYKNVKKIPHLWSSVCTKNEE